MSRERLAWLASVLLLAAVPAAAGDRAVPDGRALFQGHTPFAAGRAATANRLPPAFAACAGCHGTAAQGGREGGAAAPPIAMPVLLRPHSGEPAYASTGAVLEALGGGVGRGGRALDPVMPRFRLTGDEAAALLAYLEVVGTAADRPPGVSEHVVALGTVLPLSGPAARTGRAVLDGLRDALARIADDGVHGRRPTLVAEDGARNGGPVAALRRLASEPVYAVVGGLWAWDPAAEAFLAEVRIPHVGSLVVRRNVAVPAASWTADLLAPTATQAEALSAALRNCDRDGPRLALLPDVEQDAAAGVHWADRPSALLAAVWNAAAPGCVGTGLAGAVGIAGRVPAGWRLFAVLPFPAAMLGSAPDGARRDTWRDLGLAAGRLAVEALAQAGPALAERSLLSRLPSRSSGFAPIAGIEPLGFGPRRAAGWDPAVVELAVPVKSGTGAPHDDDHRGG